MRRATARRRWIAAAVLVPGVIATSTIGSAGAANEEKPSVRVSDSSVIVGERVSIQGRAPASPNTRVQVRFRPAGKNRFETVKATQTGPEGGYAVGVVARRSGFWTVRTRNGQGAGDLVRVRSRTRAIAEHDEVIGNSVRVKGYVRPGDSGRRVVVHIGDERIKTRTRERGRYSVSWNPPSTGRYRVTVVAKGNDVATRSRDRGGRVTVYRPVSATWYGPGLYGNTTACGQTLTSATLGVAHKTLPCGTKVHLRYGDNKITVPVIDRGPFHPTRELDLTYATKSRLGFGDVGTVLMAP